MPDGYFNHPPWHYTPVPNYELRKFDHGYVVGASMTPKLSDIAHDLGRFHLPPQKGAQLVLAVIDGNQQIIFGFHTNKADMIEVFGVEAVFKELLDHADFQLVVELERMARSCDA
jgi:hypothetical protein